MISKKGHILADGGTIPDRGPPNLNHRKRLCWARQVWLMPPVLAARRKREGGSLKSRIGIDGPRDR